MKMRTAREVVTGLGIGEFNATMIIPFIFFAPATTDPRSAPIIILVRHIQRALNQLGAGIRESGYLDVPTAQALDRVVGPGWESATWATVGRTVLDTLQGGRMPPIDPAPMPDEPPIADGMPLGSFSLPDVPGGIITYAAAGAALYYFLTKRKRG